MPESPATLAEFCDPPPFSIEAQGLSLTFQPGGRDRLGIADLSARERDVLKGLLDGLSNKEIARDLAISPRTVEAYRANLMMKMGAESLSELVRMSLDAEGEG